MILGFCVFWGLKVFYQVRTLREDFNIDNGGYLYRCQTIVTGNAGSIILRYYFFVNGRKFSSSIALLSSQISVRDCNEYLAGNYFPVAFVPSDPEISSLLVLPDDFERFGRSFPDSLYWVLSYVDYEY